MNQKERLATILKLLDQQEKISQEELMSFFSISKDTARRDILKLVTNELVERYPGGISRPLLKNQLETYKNRLVINAQKKEQIVKEAVNLIEKKDTIYLDVSTTVNFLANELHDKQTFVVTNSIDNAISASNNKDIDVYLLGGMFNSASHVLSGESVISQIKQFNFDMAFIGGAGMTSTGIFYSELSDIYLKKAIIHHAQKVCLLIDSSKINKETAYKIDFSGINMVISDKKLPDAIRNSLEEKNIKIIYPEEISK